jgi:hypothetical protein
MCVLLQRLEAWVWTTFVQERWSYYSGYDTSAEDGAKRLYQNIVTSQTPKLDFSNPFYQQTTHECRANRCGGQA